MILLQTIFQGCHTTPLLSNQIWLLFYEFLFSLFIKPGLPNILVTDTKMK